MLISISKTFKLHTILTLFFISLAILTTGTSSAQITVNIDTDLIDKKTAAFYKEAMIKFYRIIKERNPNFDEFISEPFIKNEENAVIKDYVKEYFDEPERVKLYRSFSIINALRPQGSLVIYFLKEIFFTIDPDQTSPEMVKLSQYLVNIFDYVIVTNTTGTTKLMPLDEPEAIENFIISDSNNNGEVIHFSISRNNDGGLDFSGAGCK